MTSAERPSDELPTWAINESDALELALSFVDKYKKHEDYQPASGARLIRFIEQRSY